MGAGNWKIKNLIFTSLFLSFFITVNVCLAATLKDAFDFNSGKPLDSAANVGAGFNTSIGVNEIIGFIITSVLSLMGVVFLIMAIYAGYTWMMARGNEEMVEKAKNTLTNAIIGIVIVMAAYAISYFVLSQISTKALRDNSSSPTPTRSCVDDGTCVPT